MPTMTRDTEPLTLQASRPNNRCFFHNVSAAFSESDLLGLLVAMRFFETIFAKASRQALAGPAAFLHAAQIDKV